MVDWNTLQSNISVTFRQLALLQEALTHRSYLNENPDSPLTSNERLEFLGDALLNLVVAERLYSQPPALSEGEMTKLRAALVRQDTLAQLASSLQIGDYLYLGKGEEKSGGRNRQSNLACALEAIIGALFVDQGFFAAKDFILRLLDNELQMVLERGTVIDYKSRLQELVQARQRVTPIYRIIETAGPNHDKEFTAEVLVANNTAGRGRGKSKRSAEEEAARQALENLLGQERKEGTYDEGAD